MGSPLASLSTAQTALVLLAFFGGLTVVSTALGFALERALPRRRIFAVPLFEGQHRFELLGNAVFLAITVTTLTAVSRADVIAFGPPSLLRDALTFQAMLVGFQIYYWFLHRAMHTRALVRIHRWHHRSQVTTPLTGQSMSAGEALGWMVAYAGLPWALSHVAPLGFRGLVAYLAFNVFGNIVGHANAEPTAPIAASRAATWFANAFVYHALHHARWTGHYSFQAAFMDRVMGTEWNDWPALYARIAAGHPLTSLKERGDTP